MKTSTFNTLHAFLNGDTSVDLTAAREDINAEYVRQQEKRQEKATAYDEAKPVVLECLHSASAPMTVKEIYEACEADLPDDFSVNKINYALRNYWDAEVVKDTSGNVNTYSAK